MLGRAAGGDFGVVINEINYHAVHGAGFAPAELAWLELHNRDAQAVDLSGWSFARGIEFTFPAGTVLPGGGFLALCRNRAACAAVWPDVPWLGEFRLRLAKGGERITLCNSRGAAVAAVFYSDARPWPDGADGGGATLELRDANADNDDPANWAASLVAGGTPGRPNSTAVGGTALIARNAPWRFWRGRLAPPGARGEWIEPDYDDGQWEDGEVPIGYGSGVYTLTTLADMRDGYTTVFARAAFDIADPAAFEGLELLADFDDGFAAYLNGRQIARVLMAGRTFRRTPRSPRGRINRRRRAPGALPRMPCGRAGTCSRSSPPTRPPGAAPSSSMRRWRASRRAPLRRARRSPSTRSERPPAAEPGRSSGTSPARRSSSMGLRSARTSAT